MLIENLHNQLYAIEWLSWGFEIKCKDDEYWKLENNVPTQFYRDGDKMSIQSGFNVFESTEWKMNYDNAVEIPASQVREFLEKGALLSTNDCLLFLKAGYAEGDEAVQVRHFEDTTVSTWNHRENQRYYLHRFGR